MSRELIEKLLNKAYFYLYLRQRSEQEMREYLKKKAQKLNAGPEDIESAIRELREQKYLNDDNFIEAYVRYRSSFKPKGEYALRLELRQKGIPENKINSFFEREKLDENSLAEEALRKSWSRYKNLEPLKRKKRAMDFLSRRGFSFEAVKSAWEKVEKNN